MRAERDREAREYRAQGAEQALGIRSSADRERTILLAEANRSAEILRGEGDGAAVKVWKASKQLATPTPSAYEVPTFTMPDKDVWAPGIGNPGKLDKIFRDEMYNALKEIRSGKVAQ